MRNSVSEMLEMTMKGGHTHLVVVMAWRFIYVLEDIRADESFVQKPPMIFKSEMTNDEK